MSIDDDSYPEPDDEIYALKKRIAELEAELARGRVREKIAEDRGRHDAFDYMAPHLTAMKTWARQQTPKVRDEFFNLLANGAATVFDRLENQTQAYKNALEAAEEELRKLKASVGSPG